MSLHLYRVSLTIATAASLQLVSLSAAAGWAQDFRPGLRPTAYLVVASYDRVTDSTRVAFALKAVRKPYWVKSRVRLELSFTYPGRHLTAPPESVVLTLESLTPIRRGLSFGGPQKLRVMSGTSLRLEAPATDYVRPRLALFAAARRESLSFRLGPEQIAAMAAQAELTLKAGNASMGLGRQGREMLQAVVRRMKPPDGTR